MQPRAGSGKDAEEGTFTPYSSLLFPCRPGTFLIPDLDSAGKAAGSRQQDEGGEGGSEGDEDEGRAGAIKSRQQKSAAQLPEWLQPSGGKGKKRKRQKLKPGP